MNTVYEAAKHLHSNITYFIFLKINTLPMMLLTMPIIYPK